MGTAKVPVRTVFWYKLSEAPIDHDMPFPFIPRIKDAMLRHLGEASKPNSPTERGEVFISASVCPPPSSPTFV